MAARPTLALGLDFGTLSVRALLVDLAGREHGSAVVRYRYGQITERLPGRTEKLPPDFALQHPQDWIDASARAVRQALAAAASDGGDVIGIGVDFTSCTMLPARADGTPLCLLPRWAANKYAWPKLWKHHAALAETERFNAVARRRGEPWLARYGGVIGLEWFFPKVLETLNHAPAVYDAADVWLEAGDWYVWQLVGPDRCPAGELPRSTCQAGYKALWNADSGYPSPAFLKAVHPRLADVVAARMPGRLLAPGQRAGVLGSAMARRLGLPAGIAVSAAIIDAHAGVPGAGACEPGTLVMVMGTSSCHMLNDLRERTIPGVAAVVKDGILPGYFGYETGQAAVGDAFDWFRQLVAADFAALDRQAADVPPGSLGVVCLDWMNGCRTPLMDGRLRGAFTGLSLASRTPHLYRALLEGSALGLRWIVDLLDEGGVRVRKLVATGGLPHHNPLFVRICADVLGRPIVVHPSRQGPALGSAVLGALAAGREATGFASAAQAVQAMAGVGGRTGRKATTVRPDRRRRRVYDDLYERYRALALVMQRGG